MWRQKRRPERPGPCGISHLSSMVIQCWRGWKTIDRSHAPINTTFLSPSVSLSLRCYWFSLKRTVRAMRSGGRASGRGSGVTSHGHLSLRWSVSWTNTTRSSLLMAGTRGTLRLKQSVGEYSQLSLAHTFFLSVSLSFYLRYREQTCVFDSFSIEGELQAWARDYGIDRRAGQVVRVGGKSIFHIWSVAVFYSSAQYRVCFLNSKQMTDNSMQQCLRWTSNF